MSTPHLEPPPLDVLQWLARIWINRHGTFRTVSTGGQRERTGTDWGMVITEAARWGQRSGWDARGAAEARQQADQKPPLGLMPRWLADEKRLADVDAALQRYKDANLELPGEWLWERQDLLENLRRHRPAEAATVKESLTAPPAHTIAECGGPCEQDFRLCDCGLLQQLNPQRTPAPTTEARPGGLVERVAEAMQPGTFDWSAYEGEARAAIREVAAALLEWHYSDQVVHTAWEAAKWLQREADRA
jgi:hypothetical protein